MLQTNLNFLFRSPAQVPFYAGAFFSLLQNARRIQTVASNTPFPDGPLARTFNLRHAEEHWPLHLALSYPQVMTRYWQVANVLRERGFVPFVHGQSAVWSVAQRALRFLGFSGLQLLRVREEGLRSSAEIYQRIEAADHARRTERNPLAAFLPSIFGRAHHNLDHIPEFRSSLIASTVGLFHLERNESPFSFVVGGIYGSTPAYYRLAGNRNAMPLENCVQLSDDMIVRGASARGHSPETARELALRVRPFYEEASRLRVGQFLVLGIPFDRLSQAVYHSHSFGFPTGTRIEEAVRALSEGRFGEGAQARIFVSQETLADESPIEVVNVMDGSEVQRFCQGFQAQLPSFEEDANFRELLSHTRPDQEESTLQEIEDLYTRIDRAIRDCFH